MKEFTIIKHRNGRESEFRGTIAQLTEAFGYTLEIGKSWERERGNKKINLKPKTARSLVENLNNAVNNAALNGHSSTYYTLKEEAK